MLSIKKIKKAFTDALTSGCSVEKLTQSFCMGVFIAFSPVPGGHTVMMLAAKWMFGLNFPVLFIATSLNNPWTMLPFFSFDYAFGYWLVHKLFGWHPGWIIPLKKIFGMGDICLLSFLIGGTILGIFFALLCYPAARIFFKKLADKFQVKIGVE